MINKLSFIFSIQFDSTALKIAFSVRDKYVSIEVIVLVHKIIFSLIYISLGLRTYFWYKRDRFITIECSHILPPLSLYNYCRYSKGIYEFVFVGNNTSLQHPRKPWRTILGVSEYDIRSGELTREPARINARGLKGIFFSISLK